MSPATAEPERLTQLLAAVSGGDQRAFAQLYEACSAHLFGLLLRILQRRDWAEEALQDCFLKIWQKSETYEPARGAPLTWLSTIARYRALDLLRMKRPEVELPEEGEEPPLALADPSQDPVDRAIEGEGLGRLRDCMRGLQEEQRRSVLLAYYEGYTHQELAQAMQAPLGTVKSWVRRGLTRLRECLEALGAGAETE
jgi:RNA polymerase sigma-70 factor (ECF subfamily)